MRRVNDTKYTIVRHCILISALTLSACGGGNGNDANPGQGAAVQDDMPNQPMDESPTGAGDGQPDTPNLDTVETVADTPSTDDTSVDNSPPGNSPTDSADQPDLTETPMPVPQVISTDNYRQVLLQVFEVFSGAAYDNRLNDFQYISGTQALNCDNDVTALQSPQFLDSGQRVTEFVDCSFDGSVINGVVNDVVQNGKISREFTDFSVAGGTTFNMSVSGIRETACCQPESAFATRDHDYYFSYDGGTLSVNGSSTYARHGLVSGTMGGQFVMRPPVVEGRPLTVQTEQEFTYDLSDRLADLSVEDLAFGANFNSGRLSVTADDGTWLTLDANTGDESSVQIIVGDATASETFVDSWSEWRSALDWRPAETEFQIATVGYESLIEEVFDIVTGERYFDMLWELPNFPQHPVMPDIEPLNYDSESGLGNTQSIECYFGGSVDATDIWIPFFRFWRTGWAYQFENCNDNTGIRLGQLRWQNQSSYYTLASEQFSLKSAQKISTLEGVNKHNPYGYYPCQVCRSWDTYDLNFRSTSLTEHFELRNANIHYSYETGPSGGVLATHLHGNFEFRSKLTGYRWVSVAVDEQEVFNSVVNFNDPEWNTAGADKFNVGRMTITTEDGEVISLDAATGNRDTLYVSVTGINAGESVEGERREVLWTDVSSITYPSREPPAAITR